MPASRVFPQVPVTTVLHGGRIRLEAVAQLTTDPLVTRLSFYDVAREESAVKRGAPADRAREGAHIRSFACTWNELMDLSRAVSRALGAHEQESNARKNHRAVLAQEATG